MLLGRLDESDDDCAPTAQRAATPSYAQLSLKFCQ